jgi:OOP family OmpA-OmpF porin
MNTMNKLKLSGLAGALLVALFSAQAHAAKPGYVVDQSTDAVTRNNYGECWKTTYFDKAKNGLAECGDAVAAAPAAAPAPVAVTTKERISLSAKVLFDFNKANLRSAAKNELDPVVAKIKQHGTNLQGVVVEGHTDYLGSDKYNQKLSESRANTVKSYFVANGVPADKVTAVGKGETETKMTQTCKAKKLSYAKLKDCLEPDRRVEVEITGQTTK